MRFLRLIGKPPKVRSSRAGVRWLFLRVLGALYLIAFTSLRVQVLGLYGSRGIRPIRELLGALRAQAGRHAYRLAPSLLWLGAADRDLVRLCQAGQICALALIRRCRAGCSERRRLGAVSLVRLRRPRLPFVSVGCPAARNGAARDARHHSAIGARGRADGPSLVGLPACSCAGWSSDFISCRASSSFERDATWRRFTALTITTRRSRCRRASPGMRTSCPPRSSRFGGDDPRHRARHAVLHLRAAERSPLGSPRWPACQAYATSGQLSFFNVLSVALTAWMLDDDAFTSCTGWPASRRPARRGAAPRARPAGRAPRPALAILAVLASMGLVRTISSGAGHCRSALGPDTCSSIRFAP